MKTITQVLESLDPPVKHELQQHGARTTLVLVDPTVAATVQRNLSEHELRDPVQFRIIVLYAVNELRSKGSHVPLQKLPDWT